MDPEQPIADWEVVRSETEQMESLQSLSDFGEFDLEPIQQQELRWLN